MPWQYEPSPDRKHKRGWNEPVAGFVEEHGELVGKCPTSISLDLAEELINHADRIEYSPVHWHKPYPERIYVIHETQLYRATPTVPNRSYHGFPESKVRAQELPGALKERILEKATQLDCHAQVAKWLKGK